MMNYATLMGRVVEWWNRPRRWLNPHQWDMTHLRIVFYWPPREEWIDRSSRLLFLEPGLLHYADQWRDKGLIELETRPPPNPFVCKETAGRALAMMDAGEHAAIKEWWFDHLKALEK